VENILFIGSGNVAFHLKKALTDTGYSILDSPESGNFKLVFFSISDDAYPEAIKSFPFRGKIMIHTSGSVPAYVFSKKTDTYGVIYPYQTINKNDKKIDFRNIPLLITASDEKNKKKSF